MRIRVRARDRFEIDQSSDFSIVRWISDFQKPAAAREFVAVNRIPSSDLDDITISDTFRRVSRTPLPSRDESCDERFFQIVCRVPLYRDFV